MKRVSMIAGLLVTASAALAAPSGPPVPIYKMTAQIAGPDGGWDYASVDPKADRLYVARSSSVTVVDIAKQATSASLGAFAHGHAAVPISGGRLLVTSGDDASVRVLNASDGRELARIAVGKKPDAAILSANGQQAYVMNADSGTVTTIDLASMRVVRNTMVNPALEYAALTPDGSLFINDEDANEMEVVDISHNRLSKPVAMPGCEAPSGLAYDSKTNHLIAACANGKAAIVDARNRRLIDLVDIGLGPDAVILDPVRRLAFLPCGKDGVLDILALDGPKVRRVGRVTTEVGARTGAIDHRTGTIYLPTAQLAPPTSPNARPQLIPGTFHVLIVRPS
jgi:DNA-binding beta-propeller fold protein YncE